MSEEAPSFVLEMRDITKRFPGVLALDRMRLSVRPASVHMLVGENGAGKSTLMKILSGVHSIDEGEIFFRGQKLDHQDTATALSSGISMIHQELSPVLEMTIAENIFLGREPSKGTGLLASFVDFDRMYADTQALLDRLGLKYDPRSRMRDLSIAAMQLIEISKAISREASLIIMDEPTSAISDTEVAMLFRQIASLKASGVAIIYITHKMDEIFEIADDITVMRDGQFVAAGPASDYDPGKLISQMVGRTISSIFPKEDVPIGEEALAVSGLTRDGVFRNVSFTVRRGEIVGLAGLIGAGRTEVARAIFGLDPIDGGEIRLAGKPITISAPPDAIAQGIAMVSEDRKAEGLVLCRSVGENISLPNLLMFAQGLLIRERQEGAEWKRMIELLQIKTPNAAMTAENLSGGNQQKIVIAKWLLGEIKLLILDEPTRGIDVGSKSEIHKLMVQLARQGLAIIMISSELPEVLGMSDRIVVMQEGSVTGELPRSEATQENVMRLADGRTRVSQKLSTEVENIPKPKMLDKVRATSFASIYRRYGTILIFVGIFILASIVSPTFLTEPNLVNVLRQVVVVSLLACGVTFIIILGQIDVSLGSVLALCGVVSASVVASTGSVTLAVITGIILGGITGVINGLVITTFRIPSFIMTLAMTTVARGAALLYTGGAPVIGLGDFKVIGQGMAGPIPISVIILAVVVAVSWVLLNKTKFGRHVYAVGGNERAALASGLKPNMVIIKAFVFNGILCGIAGLVLTSRINSGQPAAGVGYEFDAITAVVVGGTSLMGGTGTITGTIIGSFIIGIINNILNLMNVSSYWQQIVKGMIIAVAVILDVWTKSSRRGRG